MLATFLPFVGHRIQKSVTFQDVVNDYIEAHRAGWKNVKHAQQWTNTLTTYAAPIIGELARILQHHFQRMTQLPVG
ncbi:hypothetical protein [Pseudomonas sp. PDM31]|uniref:phage integrase central domain-containing protein n=1 Tax=Pseudomonas sp. PDM31 TaxID=2854778 RepID=UPI00352988FB